MIVFVSFYFLIFDVMNDLYKVMIFYFYVTDSKVYDELEEITGLNRQTLKNYKSVAEKTEEVRNNTVDGTISFTHYADRIYSTGSNNSVLDSFLLIPISYNFLGMFPPDTYLGVSKNGLIFP